MRIHDLLCYCIIYILISTIRVSCYILFAPYSTGDEPVSPTQQYAHVRVQSLRVEFELELKTWSTKSNLPRSPRPPSVGKHNLQYSPQAEASLNKKKLSSAKTLKGLLVKALEIWYVFPLDDYHQTAFPIHSLITKAAVRKPRRLAPSASHVSNKKAWSENDPTMNPVTQNWRQGGRL